MNKKYGYSLIELIIFIGIISIIASTLLLAVNTIARKTPNVHQQSIAGQSAINCAEWFLGQRYLKGYNSINCPSTTVPNFCVVPSGYTITTNVAFITIDGDSNYKTITITVDGLERATLSFLIADY